MLMMITIVRTPAGMIIIMTTNLPVRLALADQGSAD